MQLHHQSISNLVPAYFGLLVVVLALAHGGVMPGVGGTYPATSVFAHPYRISMATAVVALAALLGAAAAIEGRARGGWAAGLAMLLAGGLLTGLALETTPWILYPGDRYSAAFMWLLAGAPIGFVTWLAVVIGTQRAPR